MRNYLRIVEDFDPAARRPAEDIIREARARAVPGAYPERAAVAEGG